VRYKNGVFSGVPMALPAANSDEDALRGPT